MTPYRHLTREQRYTLSRLYQAKVSKKEIARLLEVHPSTVTRELRRNANKVFGTYDYRSAHQQYRRRRKACAKHIKMDEGMQQLVLQCLDLDWSPEQISGRMRSENIFISHQSIYNFLQRDRERGGKLYLKLRRKKRYRKRNTKEYRGAIPNRVMITERSKEVDDRQRLGDWELDTVVGKREKMVLITAVERKTRYTVAVKARDRTNREITKRLISAFRRQPIPVLTMTADNGIEFSGHCKVKKALKCEFYFALPHHPWERGTNENTNGLLRQYFPKGETLEHITPKEVSSAVQRLNSRPRKCLNFMTPEEAFRSAVATAERKAAPTEQTDSSELHLQF